MRPGDPVITIRGTNLRETGKAVQFEIHLANEIKIDPPVTEWFPFSQISKMTHDPKEDPEHTFIVSAWIMGVKGLSVARIQARKNKQTVPEDKILSDVDWNEEGKDFSDLDDDIPF